MTEYLVLFDIDGTLLSTGGVGKRAFIDTWREMHGMHDDLADLSFAGKTDPAIVAAICARHGVENGEGFSERFFATYLRHLRRLIEGARCTVHPGVRELLEALRARGDVMIGLLTGNIEPGAWIKVGAVGLREFFQVGGFGSDSIDRAEVARAARTRGERLAGHPLADDRVIVIGDTPLDVRCARAIGAVAVAVATGGSDHADLEACGPDLLVADLGDPAPVLTLMEAMTRDR